MLDKNEVWRENCSKFLSKVAIMDGCWEWTGARNRKGYGTLHWKKDDGEWCAVLAHRVSYDILVGGIPDGMCVLHKCDNPPCVNPSHLFIGTRDDNAKDMARKGRAFAPRGEKSGMSKLTWRKVCEIRMSSFTASEEVSDWYGVTAALVVAIRSWRVWRYAGRSEVGHLQNFARRTQVRSYIEKSVIGNYKGYHRRYLYARSK